MSLSSWRAGGVDCRTMDSLAHCSLYGEQAVLLYPGVGWSSFMSDARTSGVSGACLCLSNGSPTKQWMKGPGHLSSTSKPSSSGYYSLRHGGLALKWFLTAQISKSQIFKQPLIHTDLEKEELLEGGAYSQLMTTLSLNTSWWWRAHGHLNCKLPTENYQMSYKATDAATIPVPFSCLG